MREGRAISYTNELPWLQWSMKKWRTQITTEVVTEEVKDLGVTHDKASPDRLS